MPISREAIPTNQPFALYICANRYLDQNFCSKFGFVDTFSLLIFCSRSIEQSTRADVLENTTRTVLFLQPADSVNK